jgi:hypothetical protein
LQIGFNSGFARGFAKLPYSQTSNIINMATMSGTNVTGRWIYQISGDIIKHGGCTNTTSLGGWYYAIRVVLLYGCCAEAFGDN